MRTFIGIFIQTVASVGVGAATYIGIGTFFEFDEVAIVHRYLQRLKNVWLKLR